METIGSANKSLVLAFLDAIAETESEHSTAVLDRFCHPDCVWHFFAPFEGPHDNSHAAEHFWSPLKQAFPDFEFRPALLLAGDYERTDHVSALGFVMGNQVNPWLGIPARHQLSMLRFGFNATVTEGKIANAFVMFDAIDLMYQAGVYPLRRMPGSAIQWPFGPNQTSSCKLEADIAESAQSLAIIREMQRGLPKAGKVVDRASAAANHSPHWSKNMNWYGPAGIGSSRGMAGFRDYHGALFLKAFPDRSGIARDDTGAIKRAGHFCEIGDANFAMTAGWPAMQATHTGSQWLGLPPTGKRVEMRVANWYRLSADNKIADNWVMIDVLHILDQMGLDLLDDLRFLVQPEIPRLD